MRINSFSFRVRYVETDQMGIVHHSSYVPYLEMGRIEWLRALGVSYMKMEENGIILPVISLQINYKKSALYDDLITVETRIKKMPLVKIEFEYRIFNEKKELLTEATTVLAFMDKATNKPIKCPEYILEKLRD
ncbi:acyl-CoA thioesterase [Muricauda sp. 2012CJ35-5]|uniref:Acyl-CoA thioesterase n=1 Tax=Flagellimonas spongiicola TaxID=2942208 RepID=A0ABT0PNV2_9FLAO|nr:thioesterase family protein [Allomuricauda spongiicola]MCL6273070.1 acyl-CoA thioesterase [Allomuricauda spongiicola]